MDTPILLIIFNRPNLTLQVIDALRKIKPSKMYVAADGPREQKIGEKQLCEETRKTISTIDWPCQIQTNFQAKNLGCKWGPITAINWFFENVDQGIILEDDCCPNPSFFSFCTKLLEHYKNDKRVMHISGDNFQNGILRGDKKSSYYFSKYTHSWGWATWKRAWELFSPAIQDFKSFDENNLIKNVSIKNDARKFWIKNFRQTIKGKDSWDSLWMYAVWYNNGLAVLPQNNLISNIGFGEDATHTKETGLSANMSTLQIDEMVYTKDVLQDKDADNYTFKTLFRKSILSKILIRIKKNLS